MPAIPKRRKTNRSGSRPNSRSATPVPTSRPSSPVPPESKPGPTSASRVLNPPLVLTSEKRRGEYECDYCHSDISQLPRIRCAECSDFDLCLECFITTDHSAAIARLKASVEARTAVDNLNASGGQHAQHQGKQAPSGYSGGGVNASAGTLSEDWHTGSGAINHDDSHGYRVCDNIRYPMFPSSRKVVPSRPGSVLDGTGSIKSDDKEDDIASKEEKDEDAMEIDADQNSKSAVSQNNDDAASTVSHDVMLVPDDPKAIWTVEEDLRLLYGIETHGLGNWQDISETVSGHGSSGKSAKRCMERYFDDFLGRYGHILPPYTLVEDASGEDKEDGDGSVKDGEVKPSTPGPTGSAGSMVTQDFNPTRLSKRGHSIMVRNTSSASMQTINRFTKKMRPVPTEALPEYQTVLRNFPNPKVPTKVPPVVRGQNVGRDEAAKQEQLFVKMIAGLSKEEEQRVRQDWKDTKLNKPGGPTVLPERFEDVKNQPGAELAGFMPRRGDFDIEWDNDAEQALADMEFLPGDLPEDKELKLKVCQIYNEKLLDREKRKEFIMSRKLYDYRKNEQEDAKRPRDERDLVRRMRLFERFHSPEEHKQFLADILKAKQLRKEIAQLQMYRRMGITSVAEAERFELDKNRRNFHRMAVIQKEIAAKQNGAPGATSATAGVAASAAAVGAPGKKEEQIGVSLYKGYKTTGRRRSSTASMRPQDDAAHVSQPEGVDTPAVSTASTSEALSTDMKKSVVSADQDDANEANNKDENGSDANFDIETMEGFEYLSEKEANLCRKIRLTPSQYTEVKKVLIHESLSSGLIDKEGSSSRRTVVKIDVERRGNVIDFMVQAGWVSPKVGQRVRTISE